MQEAPADPPATDLFTDDWARALAEELGRSDEFRRASAGWRGILVLELAADPEREAPDGRGVCLELDDGVCRQARAARERDRERAKFVLAAPLSGWQELLDGEGSPVTALVRGRLKLTKGSLARMMPLAGAAEQLVAAARRLGEARPSARPPAGAPGFGEELRPQPTFRSTGAGGLRFDSPPMRLWEKAKRHGVWNPAEIDLSQDRNDWRRLDPAEQDLLLRLAALFGAGEEAVTRELLPLIRVIAREGRLEEEMFLAAFLWEEAKHVEAFRRFFDRVAQEHSDLSRYHTANYRRIFYDELPAAMARLETDSSPVAQARASVTYNMIVEGVLAETGYYVYHSILAERGILPGMQQIVRHLQADESRHLAYGVFLLSRLVAEHGEPVWRVIEERMDELLPPAIGIVEEVFDLYEPGRVPFDLEAAVFLDYALAQFERRVKRMDRARTRDLADLYSGDPL